MSARFEVTEVWRTEGFSEPETVLSIPGHPWLYVSSPNQPGPGFVSRISRDGTIDDLKWLDGLQRPTGMAAQDGHLFVTDLTRLLCVDLTTGEVLEEYRSATSRSLNDVTVTAEGTLYISDPDNGCIQTVDAGVVVPWLTSELLEGPNAMLALDDALYCGGTSADMSSIGPGNFGSLHRVDYESRSIRTLEPSRKLGTWDGLMPLEGGFVTSSPATGELWFFTDTEGTMIAAPGRGMADFGYDLDSSMIYAPFLFSGEVAGYGLTVI